MNFVGGDKQVRRTAYGHLFVRWYAAGNAMALPRTVLRSHMLRRARVLGDVGFIHPAYAANAFVDALVAELSRAVERDREQVLERALARLYSPRYLAAMVRYRYPVVPISRPFHRTIEGAVEAFFIGNAETAVAALVPTVEGMIRQLATPKIGKADIKKNLCATLDALIAHEETRGDDASAERADMLRVFGNFFEFDFWTDTNSAGSARGLNRNGILHGVFGDDHFGTPLNFFRVIALIDLLTFIGTYRCSGVSMLAPDPTPESDALAARWVIVASIRRGRTR